MGDETSLETLKLRSNDTFHVTYLSEGDCKEVQRAVMWFWLVRDSLVRETPSMANPMNIKLSRLISFGFLEEVLKDFFQKYLTPWEDPRKRANELSILNRGGLQAIMDIYTSLHRVSWKDCLPLLKDLEGYIVCILVCLTESLTAQILHHNGLSLCIKSLMRQTLMEGRPVVDNTDPHDATKLITVVRAALYLLIK